MRWLVLLLALAACDRATTSAPPTKHECIDCHAREAAEWNGSLHHTSFTDQDFQASFSVEPAKFCSDCHAPLGAAAGIGCVSCHNAANGHFATKDCSGCHQFTFPGRQALMQSTVAEHAASPFAATTCTECHLPREKDGHRNHRFNVTRNPDYLRAALDVKSRRTPEGVEVRLTTKNVGHKYPTGDLFRRIVVVVRTDAGDEQETVLGRRFETTGMGQNEIADTRIAGERTVVVNGDWITAAPRLTIEVRYERVAQSIEVNDTRGGKQRRDSVFQRILLAEVVLE